jgi:tripartite-type tricarboxylate transporter receptor subunit TctC
LTIAAFQLAAAVVAVTLLTLSDHGAWAQTTRTIKIVVPNPPGGVGDFVARLLVEQIGRTHGPAMVIENRPGAGSVIGTEVVSHAAPDGNTVLITSTDLLAPHIQKSNYDPLNSLEPICYLVTLPELIAVNSTSSYATLADLLNAARAKPGELTLASTGPETVLQLGFEMLKRAAKVDMTFVPYSGGAPLVNALLGRACDVGVTLLLDIGRAVEGRQAARARYDRTDADRPAAGRANRCRIRLRELRDRLLDRTVRSGENTEGDGLKTRRLV